MTQSEKEQLLLQLEAQKHEAQNSLNDTDYIGHQAVDGIDVDAKYNDIEAYPQFEGDWRGWRAAKRQAVHELKQEIKRVEAIEPEEPEHEAPEPEIQEEE